MSLHQQALWLDRQTLSLPQEAGQPESSFQLLYSPDAQGIPLRYSATQNGYHSFALPATAADSVIKGQLTVVTNGSRYETGVQTGGVLDDVFAFDGKLGPQFSSDPHDNIAIGLWAPTAQSVKLLLFHKANDAEPADTIPMIEAKGVWSVEIENSWRDRYYLFSVTVFVPKLGQVVDNVVTDPYSPDLALNGGKTRLTDLRDPLTKPDGWDNHSRPVMQPNELNIWELHVRDFSACDDSIPAEMRGTYLAFTHSNSNGMRHLRRLAEAGLKAVHLLPTFHIYSINEDKSLWKTTGDLSRYPPDGTQQQAAIETIKNFDGFNWGYDPVHFLAPAGVYAVDPYRRVHEYRAMVQALHSLGLHVIQDQVFNHTSENGQGESSVLDKIVPGYYYRLDRDGNVKNATCCSDTASERRMMEKLMVDALVQNAQQYQIDGFRFDLMGYHYVDNMRKIQSAVGPNVYLYGEGWYAAETANQPDKPSATQANLYGSGIGTFNDRMRDAIRGGTPFSDPRDQGFATGDVSHLDADSRLRASLAGNMRDFSFDTADGKVVRAGTLNYNGQAAGYTASPIECINFCSVHDNQVLFDAIQLKAPSQDDTVTRARRQVLALSLVVLGQGIPFFHAGDELLRSKDMDHNSYNSGDWFNRLDFTYQSNRWGVGLPLASENEPSWPLMQPLLANPALKPTRQDILATRDAFEALLRVRASSGLFHMQTLQEVQTNLKFLTAELGVIAMSLQAATGSYSGYQNILVVFNALNKSTSVKSAKLLPHPAMKNGGRYDDASESVQVLAITAAVFVGS